MSHTGIPNYREARGHSLVLLPGRKGNAFLINRYYSVAQTAYKIAAWANLITML